MREKFWENDRIKSRHSTESSVPENRCVWVSLLDFPTAVCLRERVCVWVCVSCAGVLAVTLQLVTRVFNRSVWVKREQTEGDLVPEKNLSLLLADTPSQWISRRPILKPYIETGWLHLLPDGRIISFRCFICGGWGLIKLDFQVSNNRRLLA